MREAPEPTIGISARTFQALGRESEWPAVEVHRRFIEAGRRQRLALLCDLPARLDEALRMAGRSFGAPLCRVRFPGAMPATPRLSPGSHRQPTRLLRRHLGR